MSTMRPACAKIIQHAEGLGAPSAETVRRRAIELARIDGRYEYLDKDWHQAKRELHGGHDGNGADGETQMSTMISEHDMVVSSLGHHVENLGPDDGANIGEELFSEGMDEALHEQMLEASRQVDEQE